jgi:predicted RNA-binding protein with RPS1 domain
VQKITDVVKEGDKVKVKLLGFDERGKVRLSMKVVDQATGEDLEGKQKAEGGEHPQAAPASNPTHRSKNRRPGHRPGLPRLQPSRFVAWLEQPGSDHDQPRVSLRSTRATPSLSKKYVFTSPIPLIVIVPRSSKVNASRVRSQNASLTWMRPGDRCDSMRAATFTASPHTS